MYYRESATIVDEHPSLTSKVNQVDQFIAERDGEPFYLTQLVDNLQYRISVHEADLLLDMFLQKLVLVVRNEFLCPKHKQKIDYVSDDALYCPLCGKTYTEEKCVVKRLYTPKVSELKRHVYDKAQRWANLIVFAIRVVILVFCVGGLFDDLSAIPYQWLRALIKLVAGSFGAVMLIESIWGRTFIHGIMTCIQEYLARILSRRFLHTALRQSVIL